MTEQPPKAPEDWRNFTTHFPITACRLKHDGLKQLYRILNEKQKEYRDKVLGNQFQQPNESPEVFNQRKNTISNAFVISVTITAENEEVLTGNREEIFDDINLPARIRSVFYSSQSVLNAVLQHVPQDRVTLFLDFSRPQMVDFGRLPSLPTPNESNFEIGAINESWFAATKLRLIEFFGERRSSYEWLHRAGAYDVLLFAIGLPLAVWACARLETIVPSVDNLNIIPRGLVYGYTFLGTLIVFRVLFSYSRWVFPKIEIENDIRRSPLRHRGAWVFVIGAILGPALYDVAKLIVDFASSSK